MFRSYLFSILTALILLACNSNPNTVEDFAYTNALINETSPYLLQHAHNPVDWYAWNDSTLAKAMPLVIGVMLWNVSLLKIPQLLP